MRFGWVGGVHSPWYGTPWFTGESSTCILGVSIKGPARTIGQWLQFDSVYGVTVTNYTTCVEPRVELQRGRLHVMHGDLDVSFRP